MSYQLRSAGTELSLLSSDFIIQLAPPLFILLVELPHELLGLHLGSVGIAAGLACNLCHPVSLLKVHAQLPANTNIHTLLQQPDHTYVLHGKLEGTDVGQCSEGQCSEVHLEREAIPASSPQLHCDPCVPMWGMQHTHRQCNELHVYASV